MESRLTFYIALWGNLILISTMESKIGILITASAAVVCLIMYIYLVIKE